jgi:CDP-diacylglycerol pyrophosphatase
MPVGTAARRTASRVGGRGVAGALAVLCLVAGGAARAADPSALWRIVHERCVPNEIRHRDPAPCALVDLSQGTTRGYVVFKDRVGATQFLVLPTARIPGIESPLLLAPGAPDYLQDAWAARRFVEARAPAPLTRADLSLAVNSVFGRSQNQLHIHIDCLRPEVRAALARHLAGIGDRWRPFPVPLAGHRYIARRLLRPDLAGVNPFLLLAEAAPAVRAHMGDYTLVVAGVSFAGRPGFVLLADRADPARGNFGNGESLQDHSCALAHR